MKDESDEKGCLYLALGAFILSAFPIFIGLLLGWDVNEMVSHDANGDPINMVRYMRFTFCLLVIAFIYYQYKKNKN